MRATTSWASTSTAPTGSSTSRDLLPCRALADEVRPRVWVNNAGVLGAGDAATQPDEVVDRVVQDRCCSGVVHGTRAAVASMRAHGGGHVVQIASLASWVPVPGEALYAATKAGRALVHPRPAGRAACSGGAGHRPHRGLPRRHAHPDADRRARGRLPRAVVLGPPARDPRPRWPSGVVDVLERPRLVTSVPHWRGARCASSQGCPTSCSRRRRSSGSRACATSARPAPGGGLPPAVGDAATSVFPRSPRPSWRDSRN